MAFSPATSTLLHVSYNIYMQLLFHLIEPYLSFVHLQVAQHVLKSQQGAA
jgi:hypothetical protein